MRGLWGGLILVAALSGCERSGEAQAYRTEAGAAFDKVVIVFVSVQQDAQAARAAAAGSGRSYEEELRAQAEAAARRTDDIRKAFRTFFDRLQGLTPPPEMAADHAELIARVQKVRGYLEGEASSGSRVNFSEAWTDVPRKLLEMGIESHELKKASAERLKKLNE